MFVRTGFAAQFPRNLVTQATDRARSKEAGFHAHLLKPIDPAGLMAVLQDLA
jgi:CheY-like chemotaxis protein